MEKQTKNIITRELIEKELRFYNTADIKSALVMLGPVSLFFLPITVGFMYGILSSIKIENILFKVVLALLVGSITSSPIWLYLVSLRTALAERRLLLRGEFDVVVREVLYKSEKIVHRHTEEFLHFNDFKEISVDHTTFQLASQGDIFYIVHYKSKNYIKLLYSDKMYVKS